MVMQPRTVGDVMTTKIVTVSEQELLESLEEQMRRLRLRHLPVVDRRSKLVGLVTHRDLLSAFASASNRREQLRHVRDHLRRYEDLPERRVLEVSRVNPDQRDVSAGVSSPARRSQ